MQREADQCISQFRYGVDNSCRSSIDLTGLIWEEKVFYHRIIAFVQDYNRWPDFANEGERTWEVKQSA